MKSNALRRRPRRWARWGIAIAAVAIAGGLATYGLWPQASRTTGGTPKLVVDRSTIDFGDVHFDRFVNAIFTLANTGDGVLVIDWRPVVEVAKGC